MHRLQFANNFASPQYKTHDLLLTAITLIEKLDLSWSGQPQNWDSKASPWTGDIYTPQSVV